MSTGDYSNHSFNSPSASSMFPLPSDLPPEQPKDLKEVFNDLLREKNVSSNASWEYALKLIGNDSRFELFRHHKERKQWFNDYKIQKTKDEKEEQRAKVKRARENLESLLESSDKVTPNTRYRQAMEYFAHHEAWKAVPDSERREIFREVVEELTIRVREEQKAARKRNMKTLAEILDAMTSVTYRTKWEEAQQLLLDNPVFSEDAGLLGMDKEDALVVFEDHIRALEKEEEEERRREKCRVYRSQRKNREAFISLLDHMHKQGRLTSMSKWCNLYPDISTDSRYSSMLTQPLSGSTPLDLFKFYVENLKHRYEDDKETIRDILKKNNFEIKCDTSYEEFVQLMSQDDRTDKVDPANVKVIFDKYLSKAQEREKEKLREENKRKKKIENAFMNLLHSLEPQLDENSDWEAVKKAIVDDEAYVAIATEEERLALFKMYIQTVQESCSHHHSRSKKKHKKARTRNASSSSSSTSSQTRAMDTEEPEPGQVESEASDIEELERQRRALLEQLEAANC